MAAIHMAPEVASDLSPLDMAIPPSIPAQVAPVHDSGPIPMSFPAILRGSGLTDRFAHLRVSGPSGLSSSGSPASPRRNRRDEKEGKRWVRRKENARFAGNTHIVAASKQDYAVPAPNARATFPQPLPVYLHRNNPIPASDMPSTEPVSANAGRFSLSLKGMRRELRKSGPRTELLVMEIEDAIHTWLAQGVWLNPDAHAPNQDPALGTAIGSNGAIIEVSRSPSQLVWYTGDDARARYVVHCCARYHSIVSFSKDTPTTRLTYILRPQSATITHSVPVGLETPPVTDLESSIDPESDFAFSDVDRASHRSASSDVESDFEGAPPTSTAYALSAIAESMPVSPHLAPTDPLDGEDEWSAIGGGQSDFDGGDELARSVSTLDLEERIGIADANADTDADMDLGAEATPRAPLRTRQGPLNSRLWEHRRRSASSPSRSPARRPPPRAHPRIDPPRAKRAPVSFYDYLFS